MARDYTPKDLTTEEWDAVDRKTWSWLTVDRKDLPEGMHTVPAAEQMVHTVVSPNGKTVRRYSVRRGADGCVVRTLEIVPA